MNNSDKNEGEIREDEKVREKQRKNERDIIR
jgi:hypothetical protein